MWTFNCSASLQTRHYKEIPWVVYNQTTISVGKLFPMGKWGYWAQFSNEPGWWNLPLNPTVNSRGRALIASSVASRILLEQCHFLFEILVDKLMTPSLFTNSWKLPMTFYHPQCVHLLPFKQLISKQVDWLWDSIQDVCSITLCIEWFVVRCLMFMKPKCSPILVLVWTPGL